MFNGSTVFNYKNDLNSMLVSLTYLAMYITRLHNVVLVMNHVKLKLKHTVHLIKNLKIKTHCPLNQNLSLS